MAYQSATSTSPNQPRLFAQPIAGRKEWQYSSTHTSTEVTATGFFTDAQNLGMTLGDGVLVYGSTTYSLTRHTVDALSSTGATLSTGLNMSS